uniref:Uncharacterized protein n=1 Tax=Arundo donax TaxID=35708 RepID=A0A0A8YTK5_ARUDO
MPTRMVGNSVVVIVQRACHFKSRATRAKTRNISMKFRDVDYMWNCTCK